jgi:hypothetical protein
MSEKRIFGIMTSLRHKLIRWLSMGDFVLLNAEIFNNGAFRQKECGGGLIANVSAAGKGLEYGVLVADDAFRHSRGAITIERPKDFVISDCVFDGRRMIP